MEGLEGEVVERFEGVGCRVENVGLEDVLGVGVFVALGQLVQHCRPFLQQLLSQLRRYLIAVGQFSHLCQHLQGHLVGHAASHQVGQGQYLAEDVEVALVAFGLAHAADDRHQPPH